MECLLSCIHAGFVLHTIMEKPMYPLTWWAGKTGTSNMASILNVFKYSMSIVLRYQSILINFNHGIKLAVNQYVPRNW